MPDIASDAFPVIFGDFARGYTVGNRQGVSVIRDEVTRKKQGEVEFTFFIRFAGVVSLPEAFLKLKIAS
jgi:HK97 family phage major capsid protein